MLFTVMLAALEEDERSLAEQIYIKYKRQIYKIAYSVLNNHHDAEDVLNDVMLNVINNIEKFVDSDGNKAAAQIVWLGRFYWKTFPDHLHVASAGDLWGTLFDI